MGRIRQPSAVPNLFRLSCPAAIRWLIIAIVVFAIQGVFSGGFASHISQEVFVGQPAFAYLDTSASIVLPPVAIWVQAAAQHGCPGLIFPGGTFPYSIAMFPMTAPTAFCLSPAKICSTSNELFSAMTQTSPRCSPCFINACARKYKEQSKTPSSHINKFWLLKSSGIAMYPPAVIMHSAECSGPNRTNAALNRALSFHVATIGVLRGTV